MARDYYQILGISRTANEKEIRSAFRRLARKYHPDVNRDKDQAAIRFKEINEAHEVLSDPEKKRLYDRYGQNWYQASNSTGGAPQWSNPDPFGYNPSNQSTEFFQEIFGGSGLNDIFRTTFGMPRSGQTSSTRHSNRHSKSVEKIEISLEEAFEGVVKAIGVTTNENCPKCKGTGIWARRQCPGCSGTGIIQKRVRGEVTIPPGIKNGSHLNVTTGGKNVILTVSIKPNNKFARVGSDLTCEVEVPLYDVILGGEVEVPTIKGTVALNLPPETSNGQTFRLSGLGMPTPGARDVAGWLFVKIKVKLPENLTATEREQFKKLKELR